MSVMSSNGVQLAVHDFGGHGPMLLLSHATGFHGHCYLPLAHELADRFHSVAFDYRGHGDTPLPADPHDQTIDWNRYGDDALAIATATRNAAGAPIVAFGHSMGGACLLMAAARDASLFERLVLFEPIVYPPIDDIASRPKSTLAEGALRRRRTFPSYEVAIANYASKPPLNSFTPEALDSYVRHGFAEGADGQIHLKCAPETESGTFELGALHRTWDLCERIETPVLVVAGMPAPFQPAEIAARVAEQLPNGTYAQLDDLDHFGPMTHPEVIADVIANNAK